MKKLIAIVSALFLFPFTALALTPMQDDQMNAVTGQAGVSIAIDTHVALHVDTVSWGDADGAKAGDAEGWVGVSDMNGSFFIGLRDDHMGNKVAALKVMAGQTAGTGIDAAINAYIAALESGTDVETAKATADAAVEASGNAVLVGTWDVVSEMGEYDMGDLEVLTIDVGSDTAYGTYNGNASTAYVRIGLGTFQFDGDMDMDFELGTGKTLGQELGTLDIKDMVVRGGQGGYVDITTEGRASGVTLVMNVLLDEINMGSLAWGDSDGADNVYDNDAALTGGYVGLANLDINNLNIQGKVGIDVVDITDAAAISEDIAADIIASKIAGDPTIMPNYKNQIVAKLTGLMAANAGDLSSTQVILSLGDADGTAALTYDGDGNYVNVADTSAINITMASMDATAALGSTNDLRNSSAVLGNIYMGGVRVAVDGLVSISAH